jgi:hypothetical protein
MALPSVRIPESLSVVIVSVEESSFRKLAAEVSDKLTAMKILCCRELATLPRQAYSKASDRHFGVNGVLGEVPLAALGMTGK